MKKSSAMIIFLSLVLLMSSSLVLAELTAQEEEEGVNKAYDCLVSKIDHKKCSTMSDAEKAFSLLAVDKCKQNLIESAYGNLKYWPKNSPNIKTTAQAVLALDSVGEDTDNAEDWLFEQTQTTKDLIWYLEIEATDGASQCTISYESKSLTIDIGEDKKIIGAPTDDSCLSSAYDGYWLQINENCYEKTFTISCEDSYFLTTLLYKNEGSNTIHVVKETHEADAEGETSEKINSLCFGQGGNCDYESTLWAVAVLDKLGYHQELSPYMPYLIGNSETYEQYLPEAILFLYTGSYDYRTSLMNRQLNGKYWAYNTDEYFGTAFALYPFVYETQFTEKTEAKEWLIEDVQEESGCWDNEDILNTAFILHSIWPDYYTPASDGCVEHGFDCVEEAECAGELIEEYECNGGLVCCDNSNVNWCEYNGFLCVVEEGCEGTVLDQYDCGEGFECCDNESIWPPEPECINAGFNCVQQGNCQGEIIPDLYCGPLLECCNDTDVEPPPVYDCEPTYDCMYEIDCEGEVLENYECDDPLKICCDDYGVGPGPPGPPGNGSGGGGISEDCEDNGYYCMSYSNCKGEILYDYDCNGLLLCCDEPETNEKSCSELNGIICDSDEYCEAGETMNTYDLSYKETCCVGGTCKESETGGEIEYDCEINFGICEPYGCDEGYEEAPEYNCKFGDICCISEDGSTGGTTAPSEKKSLWWVWLIFLLIVLGLLGVLFRDKIKMFIVKLKSKGKKGPPSSRRGFPPMGPPRRPPMRGPPPQRRILPPSNKSGPPSKPSPKPMPSPKGPPTKRPGFPKKKPSGELNDVLKKLKDMSK